MLPIPHLVFRTTLTELIAGTLSRSQVIPPSDKALVRSYLPVFLLYYQSFEKLFFSSTSKKQFFKIVFPNSLDH